MFLMPSLFSSSAVVNLHFFCPKSASVLSSCYSWYQLTWNSLQLEFSVNDWFKLVKIRNIYRLHRSLKRQFFESRRNPSNYLKKLKLPIVRKKKGETFVLSLSRVLKLQIVSLRIPKTLSIFLIFVAYLMRYKGVFSFFANFSTTFDS